MGAGQPAQPVQPRQGLTCRTPLLATGPVGNHGEEDTAGQEPAIMQRDNELARMVADGNRSDDGSTCSLVLVRRTGGDWLLYPHGVDRFGVRSAAVSSPSVGDPMRPCSQARPPARRSHRVTGRSPWLRADSAGALVNMGRRDDASEELAAACRGWQPVGGDDAAELDFVSALVNMGLGRLDPAEQSRRQPCGTGRRPRIVGRRWWSASRGRAPVIVSRRWPTRSKPGGTGGSLPTSPGGSRPSPRSRPSRR